MKDEFGQCVSETSYMERATSKSSLDHKPELKANERDYILVYVFDTLLLYKKA